jgi:hypothetical protein
MKNKDKPPVDMDRIPVYEKVLVFFVNRNNESATIEEIVQGTDCNYESVSSLLRKRNRGRFKNPVPHRWILAKYNPTKVENEK